MKLFSGYVPLTFSPSATVTEVKVTIIDDDVFEPTERFILILSHSPVAVLKGCSYKSILPQLKLQSLMKSIIMADIILCLK